MQPSKTTVIGLFQSPHQYQIPIFQRGYVWTLEKQVAPLWLDIQDRANAWIDQQKNSRNTKNSSPQLLQKHFLGSVVLVPSNNEFGRVPAYEVIDGQQRITTLHLLMLAFNLAAKKVGNTVMHGTLEKNLISNNGTYKNEDDYHKVWPTQAGRSEIKFLNKIKSVDEVYKTYPARDGRSKVERPLMVQTFLYLYHACFAYMHGVDLSDDVDTTQDKNYSDLLVHKIHRDNDNNFDSLVSNRQQDPARAEGLYMALNTSIQIMTLSLEADDDPQTIFETLNARGEPLLASDLIRNFIFLEAARKDLDVDALYDEYWKEFDQATTNNKTITANRYWRELERQGRLTHPRIDLFFYNYTVLRSQEITMISHVFQSFKNWWLQDRNRDLEEGLKQIQKHSHYFSDLISPEGTGYLAEFGRLIKSLDVSTVTPLYLLLRERLKANSPELKQSIEDLSSYLVRRSICNLTTKGYNRFFLKVLQAVSKEQHNPHEVLRKILLEATADSENWPDDASFKTKWITRPIYKEMNGARICALLRALEYAARGTQQANDYVPFQSDLTIEHVMPQSWEKIPEYQIQDMTNDQKESRNTALHSFGNLTILTGPLNSSVSNGSFLDSVDDKGIIISGKCSKLGLSALLINTYFQNNKSEKWEESEIDHRAEKLAEAALLVWGKPSLNTKPTEISKILSGR